MNTVTEINVYYKTLIFEGIRPVFKLGTGKFEFNEPVPEDQASLCLESLREQTKNYIEKALGEDRKIMIFLKLTEQEYKRAEAKKDYTIKCKIN